MKYPIILNLSITYKDLLLVSMAEITLP